MLHNQSFPLFLSTILLTHFHDCTHFSIFDESSIDTSEQILVKTSKTFSIHSETTNVYVWNVNRVGNFTEASTKFSNIVDIHQRRRNCAVATILQYNSAISHEYSSASIVESIANIVRKEYDYFFFATNYQSYLHELLLETKISQGIRNKLGITVDKNINNVTMLKTSCPFCQQGKALIVNIQVKNLASIANVSVLFPNFVRNFHGKRMRISSATETKWLNEIRNEKGKWEAKRGIYVAVTFELMRRLNFTCEFFPSVGGGGTGFRFPNGTWIGTVADVLYGNSELGQVGGQTFSRYLAVDFTSPITYEWLTFTTGTPLPFFTWKAIYRPFSSSVWILLCISCLVMLVASTIVYSMSFHFFIKRDLDFLESDRLNMKGLRKFLKTCVEFIFHALVEMGDESMSSPKLVSWFRIICAFWMLFSLIVTTAYKSQLVSFLAFPNVIQPPTTFSDLASSKYSIVLQYTGAAYQLFKTSKSPTYIKIVEKMEIENSDVKCFKNVIHKKAACISWENIVDYVAHKNLSDKHGRVPLIKAAAKGYFLLGGIMMRKRSIFKKEFDMLINSAMDSGLMTKWKTIDREWILRERKVLEKDNNQTRIDYSPAVTESLTIQHLSGSLYMLLFGISVSSLVVLTEIIQWRKYTLCLLHSVFFECTDFIVLDHKTAEDLFQNSLNKRTKTRFIWKIRESDNFTQTLDILSKIKNLHQNSPACAVAIISLFAILTYSNAPNALAYLIYSIGYAVNNDHDYFLFLLPQQRGNSNTLHEILGQPMISQGIRNKLASEYYSDWLFPSISLKTSCPYCADGSPKIVDIFIDIKAPSSLPPISKLFPNFFLNFKGKVMRITCPPHVTWVHETRFENGKWVPKRGTSITTTFELMRKFNFTGHFFESPGETGYRFPNGTWIGSVGDVLYGRADIGQVIAQTYTRYLTVGYAYPLTFEFVTFATGEPAPYFTWRAIYRPLSVGSWIFVILCCVLIIIVFISMYTCRKYYLVQEEIFENDGVGGNQSKFIKASTAFMLKALLEQGDDTLFLTSVASWIKGLCLSWLLFVLIVTTAYKSKLVSFLAFPNVVQPPTTYEELAESNYKIVLQYTGALYQVLKASTSPTFENIVSRMERENSVSKCFKKVIDQKAACISWENIMTYVTHKNFSDKHGRVPMVKATSKAYFMMGAMIVRKRELFKREIDTLILSVTDSGIMEKWKDLDREFILGERKQWEKETNRTRISYSSNVDDTLTMQHLSGSFYLCVFGLFTACVGLILELAVEGLTAFTLRNIVKSHCANLDLNRMQKL
ncbi:unnamed protein product [Orchesella dallaii]|uniref:Ionotropic glutamate receptor C-terminal domain-containing protein n=1 Tax=Orchesella dallaii TaxID=48710 RepID=A0ABP1PSK9_9HEXA